MRNVGSSSTVFSTTETEKPEGSWGLVELEGALFSCFCHEVGGASEDHNRQMLENVFAAVRRRAANCNVFLMMLEMLGSDVSDGLKVVINRIRLGLLTSLVCRVSAGAGGCLRRVVLRVFV